MHRRLRPLALAAALNLTAGTAIAAAQTVMIRNGPPNTSAEVMLNGASVGTGTTNDAGEATSPLNTGTTVGEKGIDANVYVDVCDKMRRIQIVDRTKIVPAPADNCDRREISGIFWVRTVNTIVFDWRPGAVAALSCAARIVYKAPRDRTRRTSGARADGPARAGGAGYAKLDNAFSRRPAAMRIRAAAPTPDSAATRSARRLGPALARRRSRAIKPRQMKATGGDTFSFIDAGHRHLHDRREGGHPGRPGSVLRPGGAAHSSGHLEDDRNDRRLRADVQYKPTAGRIWGGGAEVWIWKKIALYADPA